MNNFAHVLPYLDQCAEYAIGCVLPDWLGAVDRHCRVRRKHAAKFLTAENVLQAELSGGIVRHIDDDRWFHATLQFTELNMVFALELRELLVGEPGFRPGFLGHILIELLIDAYLHDAFPDRLDQLYRIVAASDPLAIQIAVNRMATRPTDKLAEFFPIFLRERYLYDYIDDEKLMVRINHVLKRVRLNPVADELRRWLPTARRRVYDVLPELLVRHPQPPP